MRTKKQLEKDYKTLISILERSYYYVLIYKPADEKDRERYNKELDLITDTLKKLTRGQL
jgi:hypothetical protein